MRVAHGGDYGGVTLDTELVEQQGRQTVEEPVARLGAQGGGAWGMQGGAWGTQGGGAWGMQGGGAWGMQGGAWVHREGGAWGA